MIWIKWGFTKASELCSKQSKMKKLIPLLLIISACASPENNRRAITVQTANTFFELYKARTDWQAFQDLYADDLVFEDVIFRYTYDKPGFIGFYNWPDPLLSKHPDFPEVMVLEDLTFTDSTAIGRGYFTPFYYDGVFYDEGRYMRFIMALQVNEEGKINRHTDFVEYPPSFLKLAAENILADSTVTQ